MNFSITIILLLSGLVLNAQHLEVDGKITIKDINRIATFQSSNKNSFISFQTNDDPDRAANIGYFDNIGEPIVDNYRYFFIDGPGGGFGEFIIGDGKIGINTISPGAKLHVQSDFSGSIRMYGGNLASSTALEVVNGFLSVDLNNGTALSAVGWDGYGLYGLSEHNIGVYGRSSNSSDFWAHNGTYGGTSSRRWKRNIEALIDPLEKLAEIRGVTFDWDEDHGGKHAVGFIAEEVGKVYPEVVFYEDNGIDAKGMDYSKMTPLLVEAANAMRKEYIEKFEEQQLQIAVLTLEMAELKSLIKAQVTNTSDE